MKRILYFGILLAVTAGCMGTRGIEQETAPLEVRVVYPSADSSFEMGRSLKSILEVRDASGAAVTDAQLTLKIGDASGNEVGIVPAVAGDDGIYRSEALAIPHRSAPGTWILTAIAVAGSGRGQTVSTFEVRNSTSERLLHAYGFWADDPSLGYIETSIGRERGDADNGDLIWGGFYIQMHLLRESRMEVYWREGDHGLDSPEQVRAFLLDDVGNLGFSPLRELGDFQKVRFKDWEAWQAPARGRLSQYDIEYVVFYAPEIDKTYALSTMVAQPPKGRDAHLELRQGFEVHPEIRASGVAAEPLVRLLPTPKLLAPAIGTPYRGAEDPITLTWGPVKDLAPDEYYRVKIDFDYAETNTSRYYATTEPEFQLPAELYATPNCGIFNWQVTLMRQKGVDKKGQPVGEPLSYDSLHWYVEWRYPSTDDAPFQTHCQNPQT